MLTIEGSLQAAGLIIYQDEGNALATAPVGFYALPDQPRFAVDEKGQPKVELILYRGPGARGGTLRFELVLTPADDRLAAAAAALRKQLGLDVPLAPVPFVSAQVALTMAAEAATGDFVSTRLAAGAPFKIDGSRIAVMMELAMDGAVLVRQGATGGLPLRLEVDLEYELRPRGVTLRGACDGAAGYATLRALADGAQPPIVRGQAPGDGAIPRLAAALLASGGGATATVTPSSPDVDPDAIVSYSRIAEAELTRRLGAFLAATPLPGDDAGGAAFATALAAAIAFTIDSSGVARQPISLSMRFAPGGDPNSWIREVDLDDTFFNKPPTEP